MASSEPVPKNPSIKYPKVDYSQLINVDEILQQSELVTFGYLRRGPALLLLVVLVLRSLLVLTGGEDPAVAVGRLLELVFNTEVEQVTSLLKGTRYAHLPENSKSMTPSELGN